MDDRGRHVLELGRIDGSREIEDALIRELDITGRSVGDDSYGRGMHDSMQVRELGARVCKLLGQAFDLLDCLSAPMPANPHRRSG
jgi:hypothetical protein